MAKLQAGIADPNTLFNLNGLDYKKGIYEVYYLGEEVDSNGDLIEQNLRIGIRNQVTVNHVIQYPIRVQDWVDATDTPFPDRTSLVTALSDLLGFDNGGGVGSGINITQRVPTFDDLVAGTAVGDLAYAENSQGTAWLPFTLGGTYYPAGWYVWDGTVWSSDRNAIANQLEQNILAISGNDADILALQGVDAGLQGQITSNDSDILDLQNDLAQEVTDRTNADNGLQSQITDNDSDITGLQSDLAQEVTDRTNADSALQGQIASNDGEIATLQIDLVQETANRQAVDTALSGQIASNDTDIAALQAEQALQDIAIAANTLKESADGSVDTHSDVDTTTNAPAVGDRLIWDGSNWVVDTPPLFFSEFAHFATILADGTILDQFGAIPFTVGRPAVGAYQITLNNPFTGPTDNDYAVLLTVRETAATSDDISITYDLRLGTGFLVQIAEQDNGATAGVPVDKEFSMVIIKHPTP